MFPSQVFLSGYVVILTLALAAWLVSLVKRDVSVVDSFWPLFFLAAAAAYASAAPAMGGRAVVILVLTTLWALRLSIHLAWRNWGEPEDRRYRAIRRRNEPNFAFKSLYLVFGLQASLAWIISLPLFAAIVTPTPLGLLDAAGAGLWVVGFTFETVADWQLARFKRLAPGEHGVMDRGLWRYTRHPNYFGDCCVWWSFYLIALAGGGWWSFVGPLLMSFLLLRVSGVTLLEHNITSRRPAYRDYIARTNAFFPGPPRGVAAPAHRGPP